MSIRFVSGLVKRFNIDLQLVRQIVGHSIYHSYDVMSDAASDALDLLIKIKESNRHYFENAYVNISQTMTDVAQVRITIKWEVIDGLSSGLYAFGIDPF